MLTTYETQQLDCARRCIERSKAPDGCWDVDLAFYIMRDLPVTERLGLDDLAYALATNGGTLHEAEWLLEKLENEKV